MKLTILKLVMSIMYPSADVYTFQDQELVATTITEHGYPRKIEKVDQNIWFLYTDKVYEVAPNGAVLTSFSKSDSTWTKTR
jgi:hypothetical protein